MATENRPFLCTSIWWQTCQDRIGRHNYVTSGHGVISLNSLIGKSLVFMEIWSCTSYHVILHWNVVIVSMPTVVKLCFTFHSNHTNTVCYNSLGAFFYAKSYFWCCLFSDVGLFSPQSETALKITDFFKPGNRNKYSALFAILIVCRSVRVWH